MHRLLIKGKETLKEDGIKIFMKKSLEYTKYKLRSKKQQMSNQTARAFVDVLFINGCDSSVPHPARYRVTHQKEQLAANNIVTDEVYYLHLDLEMIKYSHTFVFFRCPYTETIGEFIALAKKLNKTVLFDIDDLVIDKKYTDTIKYVQTLQGAERALYDDGVERMGKTLSLCEGAITTTERLATELNYYVPEVFINRNTASDKMYELSEKALKKNNRSDNEFRIGYFSGSITHNDDFQLVLPALCRLMKEHKEVRLYIVGELSLPPELEPFKEQVVALPFMDWKELPEKISWMDVNIAPLEQSIFNEAKSENKWVEAALVKVPTVASNVGAFQRMIEHNETGILCNDDEEWYMALSELFGSKEKREKIANKAYDYVKENCVTIYTGNPLAQYIKKTMKKNIVFVFPSTEISGGIMVALKHAVLLQRQGYDVTILAENPSLEWIEFDGTKLPVVAWKQSPIFAHFDKAVATMWTTTLFTETHPKIAKRYYLVQNYETDFYTPDVALRIQANQSYNLGQDTKYITISKWCQKWLKDKYNQEAVYAPNGIDLKNLYSIEREFTTDKKIRILIEGDCAVEYKNVDESFKITNQLDKSKYEIWYMSYNEKPKSWYQYDKFLHRVPYAEVGDVYRQCHILLKSSLLESFSYPPLEMMATGGYVVAVANGGNVEYLKNEYNCLFYKQADIKDAVRKIEELIQNEALRVQLKQGAEKTVSEREWKSIEEKILKMYE